MKIQTEPQLRKANTTNFMSGRSLLLQRQCACGGRAGTSGECATCANKRRLQAKLSIGASNDPLEQDADRVADQVLAAPVHPAVNTAPNIQRYTGQASSVAGTAPASVDQVLASGGRPLESGLQQDMGQRFGHDFSRVRIHADARAAESANAVSALAYTVGEDIAFASNQYNPASATGRRLLAHELTHMVQQARDGGAPRIARKQTPWPAWHQTVLNAMAAIAGPSDGKDAEARWPQFAAYLCKLSKERAGSLYQRLGPTSAGLIGGTDDFATYLRAKFPTHHTRTQEILDEIAREVLPAECKTKKKEKEKEKEKPEAEPAYEGVCGPDITSKLSTVLGSVKSSFAGANVLDKGVACQSLISLATAGFAWDIPQLFDRSWIALYDGCATKEKCKDTVEVSKQCHDPGAVNYVLFGTACGLCFDWMKQLGGTHAAEHFSEKNMSIMISVWKKLPGKTNEQGAQSWATLGWHGFKPGRVLAAQYPLCKPSCGEMGSALDWQWVPLNVPKLKEG